MGARSEGRLAMPGLREREYHRGSVAAFTVDEILDQLDACAKAFTFPMLDNGYVFPVDTRLTAYRDDLHWAIAIEVLGYSPRAGQLDDCIHLYGNCLRREPGTSNEDFLCVIDTEVEDPDTPEHALADIRSIGIRGREVPVRPPTSPCPLPEFFRSLVPGCRALLLDMDEELEARLTVGLPRFLRLEEWSHPDVVNEVMPSESETFQVLARALCSGDASEYRPRNPPNTHRSNWPDGGSL